MFGLIRDMVNNGFNAWQQADAQDFQRQQQEREFTLNEQAAENAYRRQEKFYLDYQTPAAIAKQLREAGLNPALMYSGGAAGVGGHSAGGQGGAGSGSAPSPLGAAVSGGGMGLLELAQARKTNAESELLEKYGAGEKEAEIGNKLADTKMKEASTEMDRAIAGNQKAQTAWQEVQTSIAAIEQRIKAATEQDQTAAIQEGVKEIQARIKNFIAQSELAKANKNLSEEERRNIYEMREYLQNYYKWSAVSMGALAAKSNTESRIADNKLDHEVEILVKTAEKIAAETKNEEEFRERWDKEQSRLRTKMWLDFGISAFNAAANVVGTYYMGGIKGALIKGMQAPKYTTTTTTGPKGTTRTSSVTRRGYYLPE